MPKTTPRRPAASNPAIPAQAPENPKIEEALETVAHHFPTRVSMPSWAESLEPRPITRTELLEHARAFDVVMGIPATTRITHRSIFSWLTGERVDLVENTSYVQRGVLYLTPSDMNFFMTARKTKETSNDAS